MSCWLQDLPPPRQKMLLSTKINKQIRTYFTSNWSGCNRAWSSLNYLPSKDVTSTLKPFLLYPLAIQCAFLLRLCTRVLARLYIPMRHRCVYVLSFRVTDSCAFYTNASSSVGCCATHLHLLLIQIAHAKTCPDGRVSMVGMKVPRMFRKHVKCKSVTYYVANEHPMCMELPCHQMREKRSVIIL